MDIYLKPSVILSVIIGLALSIFSLVPGLLIITFFAFWLIGGFIVFYLKKNSFVGILSTQDGALIGAISGFVSCIAFLAAFLPLSLIVNSIVKIFTKTDLYFTGMFASSFFGFFSFVMLALFVALLSALFNGFSGLAVAYVYERIEATKINRDEFHFEVKD